ncbi:MAG TPA: tetratricopeptide repeat protein [Streptosporangiaceae bacterium]
MDFRILGPVELQVNGQPYSFGSPKERCVLAVLLYDLGQPVATETLIDRVWGENLPESPRASLYSYLSRLRKGLKQVGGSDHASLRWRSGYYTLDASPDAVDLCRFRALRAQARAIGDSGDDEHAAELLRDAEKLWRGIPLAGLSGAWAERVRAGLEEERLAVTLDRIKVELRLGQHADLVGEISDLVAQHPFNETLVEHLMFALYQCGRQADALEAYRRTHRRFSEELGSEPRSRLRALHHRILNEDPALVVEPMASTTAASVLPNSLPRDNPDFTGRVGELNKLFGLIDSKSAQSTVTVVAISGMAGVGKSAFATHAAHLLSSRYPHVYYLGLHAHDPIEEPVDPASGLGILLRTLGVPPERIPSTCEERATLWRTQLANRRALIVLDDASDAEQIRPLLPGTAGCLVLVTCRRRMLELSGTFWLPLDVLRSDDAASLFTHVVGVDRALDIGAIGQVVRLCDYLPLAIHLAGSRFRNHPSWTISDLAARLMRSRLSEFRAEDRGVAASLDLSYRYLTSGQQRLLRQLALHPGAEFSVYAAAAAVGGDGSLAGTELALDALLDHHLLEEPEPGRFRFHDLIREYAWHRAYIDDQESERRHTLHRIFDYYLCIAEQAADAVYPFRRRMNAKVVYRPAVRPPLIKRSDFRKWVEAERANILSIVHYAAKNGGPQHLGQLAHMLTQFLDTWGYWEDAAALHRLAIRAWRESGDIRGEARALTDLCFALGRTGRYAEALQCAHNALAQFRTQGDRIGEADALDRMGLILFQSSRYHEALSCHEEALAIRHSVNDQRGEAASLGYGAMSLSRTGKYEDALRRTSKALAIYTEIGDLRGEGYSLNNMADVLQRLGFYDEALDRYRQALFISQDVGDRQGEAIVSNNIGDVCQHTGRYDESLSYYRRALTIYREIGDRRSEAYALNCIGEAFQRSGYYDEALIHHQKALAMAHELAEPYQEAKSLQNIGNAHFQSRKYLSAVHDYRAALELSHMIGDRYQEALAEDGLGSVVRHTEGDDAARQHWQKALELFETMRVVQEADAVRDRLGTLGATGASPSETVLSAATVMRSATYGCWTGAVPWHGAMGDIRICDPDSDESGVSDLTQIQEGCIHNHL